MSELKKIAIVGAAGNIGKYILAEMVKNNLDVTVITRASSTSTFPGVPDNKIIRGEYGPEFYRKALTGQDALILAVGMEALAAQKDLIDAAAEVGVKRIIPSEFGGDLEDPASIQALPFNAGKVEVAQKLVDIAAAHPNTKWTSLVSGPFFDWCLENGILGFDVKNRKANIYNNGTAKFDTTKITTVAKAVVNILSKPNEYQNERVFIAGMTVNQQDILAAMKKATGDEKWEVNEKSAKEHREMGFGKVSKGDWSGVIEIIEASLFEEGQGQLFSTVRKVSNKELGVDDDLDASVKEYVDKL